MTTHQQGSIEVFCEVATDTETCEYGEAHRVRLVARKVLGPVIDSRPHDNGYQTLITDVRTDRQGRTYHQHVTIDFFNNVSWVRDDDNARFLPRLPTGPCREWPTGRWLR